MPSIRVYVKGKIELGRLSVPQQTMFKLGTIMLGRKLESLRLGLNSKGVKAKPLTKKYAIRKNKRHRTGKNFRDLRLTGQMLANFSVRTVSENRAKVWFSSGIARTKAIANHKIDQQLPLSDAELYQIGGSSRRLLNAELWSALSIFRR